MGWLLPPLAVSARPTGIFGTIWHILGVVLGFGGVGPGVLLFFVVLVGIVVAFFKQFRFRLCKRSETVWSVTFFVLCTV